MKCILLAVALLGFTMNAQAYCTYDHQASNKAAASERYDDCMTALAERQDQERRMAEIEDRQRQAEFEQQQRDIEAQQREYNDNIYNY